MLKRTCTVLAGAAVLAAAGAGATTAAAGPVSIQPTTIIGTGGTELKATVITPTGTPGPHPLLVMPTSWSMPNAEYVGAGIRLASAKGYEVISLTSRGFWSSGGGIDIAGPDTLGDISKTIDWAVANGNADETKVGTLGISYGAGIGLLAAGKDVRIKAVVAMSGWSDLKDSLYPNQTINKSGVDLLLTAADLTGRYGPEFQNVKDQYKAGNIDAALSIAPTRSAGSAANLAGMNANKPAVMIANSWNDSLFAPSQLVPYFAALKGAKRLMIGPGDHATGELLGALGLPNDRWAAADRWLDHYVKGDSNGAEAEAPIQFKSNNSGGDWVGSSSWATTSSATKTSYLNKPTSLIPTGSLAGSASTGWSYSVKAGVNTGADSGVILISGLLNGIASVPPLASIPLINRANAAVWQGSAANAATTISGAPNVRFTVTPSSATTSLFAYLYDVGPLGVSKLITHKPFTIRGATPGVAKTLEFGLEPTLYTVAKGRKLALVVDTVDARYTSDSTKGTTLSFSSPAAAPSLVSIPTR